MQAFVSFLASDTGKIISGCVLFIGLADILLSQVVIGKLIHLARGGNFPGGITRAAKTGSAKVKSAAIIPQPAAGHGMFFHSIWYIWINEINDD